MDMAITGANSSIKVSDAVFARDYSEALVHQVVVAYQAGGRAGTKAQKSRSDVRGSNRKPFKQKGTGNARAGTRYGPLWRSGGVTFAARPRSFAQKVNRKMYRGAMRAILSELIRQQRLLVVKDFDVNEPRTSSMRAYLDKLDVGHCMLVSVSTAEHVYLASRNIPGVYTVDVKDLDPVSLVQASKVVMTIDAINKIEEWLA
ncbi:MAG: 50S ribosomal protein L4 [Gammaproteobacteria bacterium]|jgi:large subunit ribosomal protein L4|nr:50S ribosomal protein L4 [Gammaproteobacteria bacterium]